MQPNRDYHIENIAKSNGGFSFTNVKSTAWKVFVFGVILVRIGTE